MSKSIVREWFKTTLYTYWQRILIIAFATTLLTVNAALPMVWQIIIDQAIAGAVSHIMIILFTLLFLVRVVPIVYFLEARFINNYEFDTRFKLFKHVLRLSIPFHKDKESTKILLEANKGARAATSLLQLFLQGDTFVDIPIAIFSLFYIGFHSLIAAAIIILFFVLFFCLNYLLSGKITKAEDEYNELDNDVSTREREIVQQIEMVKLCRAQGQEQGWSLKYRKKMLQINNRLVDYYAWFEFVNRLAYTLPLVITLIIFLPSVVSGHLSVGTLIALQMYASWATTPAGHLGNIYREIKTNIARLKPALHLLEQQPTIVESNNPVEMKPLRHKICFKNISFKYPDTEKLILCNISLTIPMGETLAIVGKTGSGKTTLARLLVRFYDPSQGLITIDETDLRQFSFDSLYQQISYVTQEVPILTGTIGENIRYGLSECGDDRVLRACDNASANFVFQWKQGLKTKVGEQGEKLSGGERQRLALARIFLRNPSVLILDEATAALDQITESDIQATFDQLLKRKDITMIVIAHRINTVKGANRILVMDRGRIVDIGKHEELMSRCDLYQKLCSKMK